MTIKAVVFDWDGTLYDSMDQKTENLAQLFSRHFMVDRELVARLYRHHSGIPRYQLFQQLISDLTIDLELDDFIFEKLSREFSQMNIDSTFNCQLFPEVTDCFQSLHALHVPLYVSSASEPEELSHIVDHMGLSESFIAIWGSQPGFQKGPDHLLEVADWERCSTREILFIGDDINDLRLGLSAGVNVLRIVRNSYLRPQQQHCITSLSDIFSRVSFKYMNAAANELPN